MSTVTKAIILGAGQGKRLLPLTAARPKCLLEFSGRTLLSWQLSRLRIAGVTEAVVVTGFEAETVEAEVAKLDLGPLKVRTLFNPFYAVADNLVSCWVARSEFAGGTLLLNGDTLFETDIARNDGGVHVQSIEGLSWAETDFPQDIVTTTALTEQWLAAGA